jgi:hypothetical protein
VTPLLLGPVLLIAVLLRAHRDGQGLRRAATALFALGLACTTVCGWYYANNWLALGRPFIGGWDPAVGNLWVQPPGYRMPADLYAFGAALTQPVLAGVHGFWNGLHSTLWLDGLLGGNTYDSAAAMRHLLPWNPALLVAGAVLALIPGALILRGGARALACPAPAPRLAALALAIHLAALLEMYMRVPAYSSLKASYMLGLLPCFGMLAGAGIEAWSRTRVARATLLLGLVGWWIVVYATYWSR